MSTYFVTGGTGFLGRRIVGRLLARPDCDAVYVLVRPASRERLAGLARQWPDTGKLIPVLGDLAEPGLALEDVDIERLTGSVDHIVHLGAIYDLTATEEANRSANIDGTARVIELAARIGGLLHHVSSIAVAGDHRGRFSERDFDLGQRLPAPYHQTKFAAERLVREQTAVPWRVYRPGAVVGDSATGEMDKIDGPYYFFPLFAALARLPRLLPLIGPDLGATNVVPVDYVIAALEYLLHADHPSGSTFHLTSPRPQPLTEVYNAVAKAAGAPRMLFTLPISAQPLLRRIAGSRNKATAAVLRELGMPREILPHMALPTVFDSAATEAALSGSGLRVPELRTYAGRLWRYWAEHLDVLRARRNRPGGPLSGRRIVITGASSGIGRATALAVVRHGAVPLLVARRGEELERLRAEIEQTGGTAFCYPCDLTDGEAVDALVKRLLTDHPAGVDMVVNNAGKSIRRGVRLSVDRIHDYERTMALNYFAPVRLVLGLLPHMVDRRFGHIVNVSTAGVQTITPRFSAYLASKAALDMFGRVASTELLGDGVTFTNVHMPLVRTPMIEPTSIYRRFPSSSPEEAAELVITALVNRPVEVNVAFGTLAGIGRAITPKLANVMLYLGFRVMPESAPEAKVPRELRERPAAAVASAVTRLLLGIRRR